jgi:hypothetical protein
MSAETVPCPETKYPGCYLHVREERSGQEWIMAIRGNSTLNIERLVKRWIRREFGGELALDDKVWTGGSGLAQYSATIYTDGRPPGSTVCWTSCGFWMKPTS